MVIQKSFGVKREYIDILIFFSVNISWEDSKTKCLILFMMLHHFSI